MQPGDNLISIAQANLPPGADLTAYANAIAAQNGLSASSPLLNIGQKLLLPKHP